MSPRIFLSHSGKDEFEASLLQEWIESRFASTGVTVWTFERDQGRYESNISQTLKSVIRDSTAVVFLLSPFTIEAGGAQWWELGCADAYEKPTFILLHHLSDNELVRADGLPPLVRQKERIPAIQWKSIESDLRTIIGAGAAGLATTQEGEL